MNKKILFIGLLVLIVVIGGAIFFGFKKAGVTNFGVAGGKSLMDQAREKGEQIMSKDEYAQGCEKSDADMKDTCYAMAAFYYRDASFCQRIKATDVGLKCNQANIEKKYADLEKGISPFDSDPTGFGTETPQPTADIYGSTKEVAAPTALASEMKSILSEACGEVKLSEVLKDAVSNYDIYVYVWKNTPTTEKIENALKNSGYIVEVLGEVLIANKGNLNITVSWNEEVNSQKIAVMFSNEE